jgi:hypothetical protein
MDWVSQILNGTPDEAAIEHLRCRLDIWLKSATKNQRGRGGKLIRIKPVSLGRCLGLPDNPEQVRRRLRDNHLRSAACCLAVDQHRPWQAAAELHREAHRFSHHQWLCWVNQGFAPDNCSELDRQLFAALRWGGGVLPETIRQYRNILKT